MSLPITTRQLHDGARGLAGWALAMVAVLSIYLPLFPSMNTPALTELLDSLPESVIALFGKDIATGAGYTQATFHSLIGFILGTVACVTWAAAATGGAEESGRLELTLAHAIGRTSYLLQSVAAMVVRIVALGVIVTAAILAFNGPFELGLAAGNVALATLAWAGLCLLSGMVALVVGALTGRRSWALGAGAGFAALSYVLDAAANFGLNGADTFSPYSWAYSADPIGTGSGWPGAVGLWVGCAVLCAAAVAGFARRDIGR